MSLDSYGLEFERYKELFTNETARLLCLYINFDKSINETVEQFGYLKPSEKTKYDLFTDVIYATNENARKLQRKEDPDAFKQETLDFISPSREELVEKMNSLSTQIETLTDYVNNLATIAKAGLTDLVD